MMELDEAICHCEAEAKILESAGCIECAGDHIQLAIWLKELRERRKNERPQGKWIEYQEANLDTYYECSNCREPWTTIEGTPWQNMMNFCPNCGADMQKGGAE